jgi:AraC-like DNA-binding protein
MVDPAGVAARNALPVLAGLKAAGLDPNAALAEAGLSRADFVDPDTRVPHDRVVALWKAAMDSSGDPEFGLVCSRLMKPGDLGVLEYVFRKSRTLREGIDRVCRYFRIGHDVARFELSTSNDQMAIDHVLPGSRTLPRAPVDFVLANPVAIARNVTSRPVNPLRVFVDYPQPEDTSALEAHFQCELVFDSGRRALVYALADADTPLLESDPGLRAVLDRHARQVLESLPTISTLSDRVREFMAGQLSGGNADAQAVAEHLRMSVRTLHRKLADEGTSHKLLLDELRRELSQSLLRQPNVSISEVAFLLGFSEPSAFHRAYKRWTGTTPAQARADLG